MQTRVPRRIMRICTTDVSGHAVLYRPAVSWLTWHLSITSAQFTDTQMNKVGHMSQHASISLFSSTLHLCLHFLFQLSFYSQALQYIRTTEWSKEGKKYRTRAEMRELQKQIKKYPLHRPCILYTFPLPSILFLPFLSYCGNVLQVCCILTCKSRRIIDFLTSLEDNQRIERHGRCDGVLRFPVCLFRVIAFVARRHE